MTSQRVLRFRREREKYWGLPVPPGYKHGPTSHVRQVYGCDCSLCLPSGQRNSQTLGTKPLTPNERDRRLRASKRGQPVPPGLQHGGYTYRTYACRCDVCTKWNRERGVREKQAWRKKARGRWTKALRDGAEYDIICWPPRNAGPDWKCPHEEAS